MNDRGNPAEEAARPPEDENPGNFKRTPPREETGEDPLNSGRTLRSDHVLLITLVGGLAGAGILALVYL